jgi:hypothetical protein
MHLILTQFFGVFGIFTQSTSPPCGDLRRQDLLSANDTTDRGPHRSARSMQVPIQGAVQA